MIILQGDPGRLKIEIIDRIYPNITDLENEDAKWLYVDLIVTIPSFTAKIYNAHIRIGELQILHSELDNALNHVQDFKVDFWTMEDNLFIVAYPTPSGVIKFDITVQENFNKLSFALDVDIPSLEHFLDGLFVELQKYTNNLS